MSRESIDLGSAEHLLPDAVEQTSPPETAGPGTSSRLALLRQVSFALSELPSENAAHRFEELCRHVARARVAANVLPATGPVGAGGDQGRDFETYRTYIVDQLGPHGGFAARVPRGAVAFACTLQQDDDRLPTKIREDVRKICSGGVAVEGVYCFLVVPMPVGVRHRLQAELRAKYNVHVEVFDRKWLSEELIDPELFWIAEEYLSIPASFAPERSSSASGDGGLPEWYVQDRDRWRRRGGAQPTLGELLDLRDGLRHATFHQEARADLPFWISLMEPLCSAPIPIVRQRARYETAVAQMRGLKDLRPADGHVADFFSEVPDEGDPARLSDAGVLLTYASIAYSFAQSDLQRDKLQTWSRALRSRVENLLRDDPPPIRRARLLEVLGQICLARDPGSFGRATEPMEMPEISKVVDQEGRPVRPIHPAAGAEQDFVDLARGLDAWGELAAGLSDLPLFPVDTMAHYVELLTPLLIHQNGWSAIVEAVDAAVALAEGDASAGDRAIVRAHALIDSDQLLDALDELQKAKMRFFHGDHPRSLASTLLALGDVYGQLHLPLAARQYALAAAKAAHASDHDDVVGLVPHSLFMASEHDYRAGSFASALQTVQMAMVAQDLLVDADVDPWADRDTKSAVLTTGVSFLAAHELIGEPFAAAVDRLLNTVDVLRYVQDVASDMSWSRQRWIDIVDAQFEGRPYSDVGARREIRFCALGLMWTITSANEYLAATAAERLAAAAQVLCADLAGEELLLVPTSINIDLTVQPGVQPRKPERREDRWVVVLSSVPEGESLDPEDVTQELMATLVPMLIDASLAPTDEVMASVERAFAGGLAHKLAPVRPYDELVPFGRAEFELLPRRDVEPPLSTDRPQPKCHPSLDRRRTPGPGYSTNLAYEMLANRYEQLPALMPVTLGSLRNDRRFATTVALLRQRRWLDWHILTAVYNLVLQVRLGRARLNRAGVYATDEGREAAKTLAFTPESANDPPIPLAPMLDLQRLDDARRLALPSLVHNWGLRLRNGRHDIDAIERLLAERYGYWTDDIEHRDLFGAERAPTASG